MGLLKNKNYAFSLLAGGILIDATSVAVTTGDGSKFPATGYFMGVFWGSAYASPGLDATAEIVKATFVSGDTFTIVRAAEGTTAKAWSLSDNFACVLTAGKVDELEEYLQNGVASYGVATGTNILAVVFDPALTAYTTGITMEVKFVNASTGAVTLDANGLGAKKVYGKSGSSYVALGSGHIIASMYGTVVYDAALDAAAGGWILLEIDLNLLDNVVEDITPQLGGTLDLDGNSLITSSGGSTITAVELSTLCGSSPVYGPNYSEADQGVTGASETLKYYIDTIGANTGTVVLRHNSGNATTTYTLTTSETIPSNITLKIEPGAVIDGAGTLTINGKLDVIETQIFGSNLTVTGSATITHVFAEWFGAIGDGSNDDTIPLQSAIDFAGVSCQMVQINPLVYKTTATLNITDPITLLGIGLLSKISIASASLPVINISSIVNNPGCVLDSVQLLSSVTRTSGASLVVDSTAVGTKLRRLRITAPWDGIEISGATTPNAIEIDNCDIEAVLHYGINITGSEDTGGPAMQGAISTAIHHCLITGSAGTNAVVGINISSCGDITINNVDTIYAANGIAIQPRSAADSGLAYKETIQALFVSDCFFDTGDSYGILMGGSGEIRQANFTNVWCASNTLGGVTLSPTGVGTILASQFLNCSIVNNGSNGLIINSTNAVHTNIIGGIYAGNDGSGIAAIADVSDFKIIGATIGETDTGSVAFGPNTGYGINITSGASNNYLVTNNSFIVNTLGAILDGGTGTSKYLAGNIGGGFGVKIPVLANNDWSVDTSMQSVTTVAGSGGLITLPAGSGMLLVSNNTTGDLGMFICYAGNIVKVAGPTTMAAGAPGVSQIGVDFSTVYRVVNGYAASQDLYVASWKVRPTA